MHDRWGIACLACDLHRLMDRAAGFQRLADLARAMRGLLGKRGSRAKDEATSDEDLHDLFSEIQEQGPGELGGEICLLVAPSLQNIANQLAAAQHVDQPEPAPYLRR
jgi:hypothetical protein